VIPIVSNVTKLPQAGDFVEDGKNYIAAAMP